MSERRIADTVNVSTDLRPSRKAVGAKAVLLSWTIAAAATGQFVRDFGFAQPGVLPDAEAGVGFYAAPGFPATQFFTAACGVLQQRDGGDPATFAAFGAYGQLAPAYDTAIEARITTLATTLYWLSLDVRNGTNGVFAYLQPGGLAVYGLSATAPTFVPIPNVVGATHVVRLELSGAAGGNLCQAWLDGVLAVGPEPAHVTALNQWFFGDGSAFGPGLSTADADWDYVRIEHGPPCGGAGQPNGGAARLEINGVGAGGCQGPFAMAGVSGAPVTFTFTGPAGAPYVLVAGPQNPAHAGYGCVGIADVGTPPFYADLLIVMDGLNPVIGPYFTLNGCGFSQTTFTLPLLPAGVPVGNFQGLVFQPVGAACPVVMTASFFLQA